jgi:GNAT superfamily N-acetyltransferase
MGGIVLGSAAEMAEIRIQAVETRRQQKEFLNLPWAFYDQDPYWIPPIRINQAELVGYKRHPFYERARVQTFLAYEDGRVAGRIAAIVNPAHNEQYGDKVGFFGFFESSENPRVAQGLLRAAESWLRDQGLEVARGPCNPSLNYECGLLVEGFDSAPFFMMTYNRPYYGALIEQAGYEKVQDMYAFWGHVNMLEQLDKKLEFVVNESMRRFNIKTRRLDRKHFHRDVRHFLDIYNRSLVNTWGFVPLSDAELDHMAGSLRHLIVPEMTSFAEVDGKVVGAMFGLLDYNPRIKQIDGKLFPFGFLRLLWNRRAIKRVRLISTNVIPEYQKWGVGLVLVARILPDVLSWGIEEAEFSWVLESNHLSRSTLQRGGAKLNKTYRLYDRRLVD